MLRLPSPFNSHARQNSVSAAGGGSTTTTCSCCVVTLIAAGITTSVHFANLAQPQLAISPPPYFATEDTAETKVASVAALAVVPSNTGSRMGLAILGFAAIPLSIGLGLMFAEAGADIFGIAAGIGIWIGLFVLAYGVTNRSIQRGVMTAIVGLIALIAIGAFEMFIWLGH